MRPQRVKLNFAELNATRSTFRDSRLHLFSTKECNRYFNNNTGIYIIILLISVQTQSDTTAVVTAVVSFCEGGFRKKKRRTGSLKQKEQGVTETTGTN